MSSGIQEIHVLLPDCLTFESGQLVWKSDVSKGSLVQLQDGDIRRANVDVSKLNEIPTAVRIQFWTVFEPCVVLANHSKRPLGLKNKLFHSWIWFG
jgi:hypothetical protein